MDDDSVDPALGSVIVSCVTGQVYEGIFSDQDSMLAQAAEDDAEYIVDVESRILDRYQLPPAISATEEESDEAVQDPEA